MMQILWSMVALASEPVVSTDDAGVVRANVLVSAPTSEVLALLRDPLAVHTLSGDEGSMKSKPDGSCFLLSYERSSPFGTVAYTARACPTANGIRSDLVQSESFHKMVSAWSVQSTAAGTEISYRYEADLAMAVPNFLVRRSTESAVVRMMSRIVARLGAGPG